MCMLRVCCVFVGLDPQFEDTDLNITLPLTTSSSPFIIIVFQYLIDGCELPAISLLWKWTRVRSIGIIFEEQIQIEHSFKYAFHSMY